MIHKVSIIWQILFTILLLTCHPGLRIIVVKLSEESRMVITKDLFIRIVASVVYDLYQQVIFVFWFLFEGNQKCNASDHESYTLLVFVLSESYNTYQLVLSLNIFESENHRVFAYYIFCKFTTTHTP